MPLEDGHLPGEPRKPEQTTNERVKKGQEELIHLAKMIVDAEMKVEIARAVFIHTLDGYSIQTWHPQQSKESK